MTSNRNIRLFVEQKLVTGETLVLNEKASHYLGNVMRCERGDGIRFFNAVDGEFLAEIEDIEKKVIIAKIKEKLKEPVEEKDIWLLFAPLKKDKTDFVIEKAVELGVSKIVPVITARTNNDRVKTERFEAQAIEAAEQCGRTSVPSISQPLALKKIIEEWEASRTLFFMDERRQGEPAAEAFRLSNTKKAAMLIGPEGGFDEEEKNFLDKKSFVKNVNLGPRILRAETAATAALAVWQAVAGDWIRS